MLPSDRWGMWYGFTWAWDLRLQSPGSDIVMGFIGRAFKAAVQCLLGYCSISVKVSSPIKLRTLSLLPLNEIHNVTHINTWLKK